MAKKIMKEECDEKCNCGCKSGGCGTCGGCFYGLGFIGAVIYYIQTATGFWMGVLGVLKAIVWPAFLVYQLLQYLGM
jgi:hypothetical protein